MKNIPVVKIAIWELVKNVQSSTLNLSHALVEVLQSNLQYFVELLLQSVIILATNNFNVVTNAKNFVIMEGVDAMKIPWSNVDAERKKFKQLVEEKRYV